MQTEHTDTDTVPDRIEREILIDATPSRVWALIVRPGWWINEGEIVDLPSDVEGDVATVRHPSYGSFRIQTVSLDEPRYAAYRWLGGANDEEGPQRATDETAQSLVEFWIVEQPRAGVLLRVVESGLASLPGGPAAQRSAYEENDAGWKQELEAARAWATTAAGE